MLSCCVVKQDAAVPKEISHRQIASFLRIKSICSLECKIQMFRVHDGYVRVDINRVAVRDMADQQKVEEAYTELMVRRSIITIIYSLFIQ